MQFVYSTERFLERDCFVWRMQIKYSNLVRSQSFERRLEGRLHFLWGVIARIHGVVLRVNAHEASQVKRAKQLSGGIINKCATHGERNTLPFRMYRYRIYEMRQFHSAHGQRTYQ